MKFIFLLVGSFLLTSAIVPLIIRLATACHCVDVPGVRRLHKKITPRMGGLAFFAGVLPFLLLSGAGRVTTSYIAASALLVGIGVIDDRKTLGWKIKMAGDFAAATIIIFGGNVVVRQIGAYGSLGMVDLGWFSVPFTYFGIVGVTNAINLLDGLNGLAGGVSLLGFLFMGIAAVISGNVLVALFCFALVGALMAFLRFNFPDARIFMGDSGSMFLGFSLAIMAMLLTQDTRYPVDPMYPVLVLLLPIFDTLRVMGVRLLKRRSPFQADRTHLHHLIVRKKISAEKTVIILWSLTAVFGSVALLLAQKTSDSYLIVILNIAVLLGLLTDGLVKRRRLRWEDRLGMRETPRQAMKPLSEN